MILFKNYKYIFYQPPIFVKISQMILAVFGNDEQWNEIKKDISQVEWLRLNSLKNIPSTTDAVFILNENVIIDYSTISKPVFINSVSHTLKELNASENVLRINGWNGFLSRSNWEIAGTINEKTVTIITALNKQFTKVPDEPGFIAARILAMIINEAWFALEEIISTKTAIDIAMKLGTNYPYGPFEWGELIGEKNIFTLLQKLSDNNKRYLPAPLLQQKISK
jgi:3-hydroxybutyryl-CoA dehydrogenase